jgi:CheY-like chemotaxis protein
LYENGSISFDKSTSFGPNLKNIMVFWYYACLPKGDPMQRVLIVDDDRLVADTLTRVFQKNGFETRTAYSTDEAIDCARDFLPNLLLCDITMPGRDGLALVNDITHELPSCRILVLTGFYSNLKSVREQASRLDRHVGILTKPCQPAELLRHANAMLATA